ncbi:hypothetical protein G6F62_015821 [Rhizopus arrhizus]|nr:hypothetical protein G6F62_015821 [Rhizopus arrhizus]
MHAVANHVRDGIAARTTHTNDLDYGPFGVVLKHLKVHHDDSLTSPILQITKIPQQPIFCESPQSRCRLHRSATGLRRLLFLAPPAIPPRVTPRSRPQPAPFNS